MSGTSKEEYVGMVDSIVKATELNRRQSLEKMAEEYKKLDIGVSEDAMLKMLWDLLQCVVEQDKIRIHFKDKRKIELAPVFLWMYQDKIYLFAYKERTLNVYSLQEMDWFTLLGSKYPRELQEKFYKISREQIHKRIKIWKNQKKRSRYIDRAHNNVKENLNEWDKICKRISKRRTIRNYRRENDRRNAEKIEEIFQNFSKGEMKIQKRLQIL